jgi:hypothetical protein
MIEYIYFVKCPNCEDEHFYFFNDAKECAMSQLSKKPIITQTEVNRNDFGECTDSCDLGTVWSWEDMMKDVPVDPEQTTFSKTDTVERDNCFDQEFDNLDNSLEPITEESEACTLGFYDREAEDQVLVSFYSFADADEYVASHEGIRDLYTDPKYTSENYLKHINQYRKPVPTGMTIESLVEEMEENEDTVECKWCDELFDKSECRYEVNLGWLCDRCQAAIKSRGETLTFREGPLDEAMDPREMVELEYSELTVTLYSSKHDVDDWDEVEHTDSHVYLVPKIEVATAIWENWITEEDVADVEGGLDALEDDTAWEKFLETHFDDLLEKYHAQILEYFKEEATEDFRERSQEEYQMNQLSSDIDRVYDEWRDERYFGESAQKPFLEEFDDAETHKASLIDCPECGTVSYDMKEQYCTNCGLNL